MVSSDVRDDQVAYDPYALPPEAIEEPPRTWWSALRQVGPGIILAGTIVGSGELILTTGMGARHGYTFLWLVLFSCVVKVFIQIELGRYAISSGKPTLGMLDELPGRTRFGHPLIWWWFVMMMCTSFQIGAMTGGTAQALNLAFPQVTAGLVQGLSGVAPGLAAFIVDRPEMPWCLVVCLVAIGLIWRGSYNRIEWLTTVIVVGVTLVTVAGVCALGATEYPIDMQAVKEGLKPSLPSDGQSVAIATAFAVFGITGVGATELFYYPYWCLEKGYARSVGRDDGSDAWYQRARGWLKVMHLDAWVSMVVFTVSTVSFYLMGAAVLHAQGVIPEQKDMVNSLAQMFVGPFGEWTRTLFLIGAGAVLFKTLYLSCAANSRLTADFLALTRIVPVVTLQDRARWVQRLSLFFPLFALGLYVLVRKPTVMVTIGGIAQGATLPMIGLAAWYFRFRKTDKRLVPWPTTDVMLAIAVLSVVVVAAYAIPSQFGQLWELVRGK